MPLSDDTPEEEDEYQPVEDFQPAEDRLERFLREFDTIIVEASHNGQLVNLSEVEVHLTDPAIRDDIVKYPEETIHQLELILDRTWRFTGRIALTELVDKIHIHDIRHDHLYTYISVPCVVQKVYDVQPGVVMAAWMCGRCGCIHHRQNQFENQLLLDEPRECPHCNRKGNQTRFLFQADQSSYIDIQMFEVQEPPEGMRGRHQPSKLECLVRPHLVGIVYPGDKLIVNGVLKSVLRGNGKKSCIMDRRLHVYGIERSKAEMDEDLTEDDIKLIKEMAKDDRILWKLSRSLAPHVYGLEFVKVGLMLQLFGGVARVSQDVPLNRGDIHILLLGDPSTAKSQLGRAVATIHPRGLMADGGSSSAVGLTAAAVKNKDDVFCIEAGALVMADGGLVFIDELDKIGEYDSAKLNEAMESQTISLHKAGAHVHLNTRCSVLSAANPKGDRFDPYLPLIPQIAIVNPTTLSRFDVIFFLKDHAAEDEEQMVARKMLEEARTGTVEFERDIEVSMIRKYVAYARENVHPVLPKDAEDILYNRYMSKRMEFLRVGIDETGIAVDRRKLRALVRLSQASARSRLAREVSVQDAELACEVMFEWALGAMKDQPQTKLDLSVVAGRSTQMILENGFNEMKEAYKFCEKVSRDDLDSLIRRNTLINEMLKDGRFKDLNIDTLIRKMHQSGWLQQYSKDTYKLAK